MRSNFNVQSRRRDRAGMNFSNTQHEISPSCLGCKMTLQGTAYVSSHRATSSIGIATTWMGEVRFPAGPRDFSLPHNVHTGSGAHLASYPGGKEVSFLGFKVAGARNCAFTFMLHRSKEKWSYNSTPQYVVMSLCLINYA
jgi:hypothetical protein